MTDLYLIKTPSGSLAPADEESADVLRKQKIGQGFKTRLKRVRNIRFHRKFFALLNYAFDTWNPIEKEYKGEQVAKNFKQFRADITVLAGFYEMTVSLDGNVKLTPKSISFANMDETEFERLYSAVIDVLLKKIFTDQTREDVEDVVNRLLEFV